MFSVSGVLELAWEPPLLPHWQFEISHYPGGDSGKEPTCQCKRHETQVRSLGWEDPLEKGMTTHCGILAWRILWTEKPGRLQFMVVAKSQTWLN